MTEQLTDQAAEAAVPFAMELYAQKARLQLMGERELLSSGMSGVIRVAFSFSEDWKGLKKTAVFSNGTVRIDVPEEDWVENGCTVPQQVLTVAGKNLTVGLYGTDGEKMVLPTVWCSLGRIEPGASLSGTDAMPPEAPIWARLEKMLTELAADSSAALTRAVNDALALAKASGEFDGAPGEKGEKGEPGPQGPGAELFYVTFSNSVNGLTVDKTNGEIYAASTAGKAVVGLDPVRRAMQLYRCGQTFAWFTALGYDHDEEEFTMQVYRVESDSITVDFGSIPEETRLVQRVIQALPVYGGETQ